MDNLSVNQNQMECLGIVICILMGGEMQLSSKLNTAFIEMLLGTPASLQILDYVNKFRKVVLLLTN